MLYFRFNTDGYIKPQQKQVITEYKNGKPMPTSKIVTNIIDLEHVESLFFDKLKNELSMSNIGIGIAYYDIVDIPLDSFSIDDESLGCIDSIVKYVLSEYANKPIKELSNMSLNKLGIKIEFCKKISNSEVDLKLNNYMQKNSFQCLTEEVLWKNMTNKEKAEVFSKNLIAIGSKDSELIIVDPYIFNCEQDDYCNLLATVLNISKGNSFVIITDRRNYVESSFEKVSKQLSAPIALSYSTDFHDRFWISNRKKGFCTGTSFNGIGKKISLVNMISDSDVSEIIDELKKQSLI